MKFYFAVVLVVTSLASSVDAQSPASPGTSPTPSRLEYQSAFDGYRTFSDKEPIPWRRANEEMSGLGGHAGHLRSEEAPGAMTTKGMPSHPLMRAPAMKPSMPGHATPGK